MKPRFVIYYVPSGMGLVKDAEILSTVLVRLGFDVRVESTPAEVTYPLWQQWLLSFLRKINFILIYKKIIKMVGIKTNTYAIHLENINYKKCFRFERHILIPNQEWFEPHNIHLLRYMTSVWCKSHYAQGIFNELGCKTDYIGFVSQVNSAFIGQPKAKDYFFSRSGKSRHRGAELLIQLWARHPEWPLLKIVMHKERIPASYPANVECIVSPVDTEAYHRLASASLLHIYMTETEGFGHSIVEAMGYGCVLLVTDAPPMNEILTAESALLVEAAYAGQKRLSPRFAASPDALERAVDKALRLTDDEILAITSAASQGYQSMHCAFEQRLSIAISSLLD